MMAGAEARAVWQRTVNRCFVQEDAKRAPKFTYCNTTTSSTKHLEEDSESSRPCVDSQNNQSSSVGFMPLHRNPNYNDVLPRNTGVWGYHQMEQLKKPEAEAEAEVNISEKKPESFQDFIENYGSVGVDECSEKKLNELAFDPSAPWNVLGSEKAGPWWRTTDKDELASLVAQRSLEFVENCDLPTPQKMKRSFGSPRGFGSVGIHERGLNRGSSFKNRTEDSTEADLSKSELLEALRHSQTRAREAENMAKEAYAEKEHLVKLLFKQASELFGYKQLLQLFQLEALYHQIKNKKSESPVFTSWDDSKARKPGRKRRSKKAKPNGAAYAVSLALGMSLVGAGLLLGWTVGWMQMLSF